MCKVLGVSRSGHDKWRKSKKKKGVNKTRREQLLKRIQWHFKDSKERYGSPKITHQLKQEGWTVSERLVGLIMRKNALRSIVSRKYKVITTDSNHDNPIAPNVLNQNFNTTAPNKIWVTDITYIPCREGRMYLASVMDLYTRKIVGWKLGDRMTTDLVLDALNQAYLAKKPAEGLIHHSDRGSQYTSEDYRAKLEEYKMTASMSRRGNCYDNASIESYHSILKKELIYCTRFRTKAIAHKEIYQYLEFFYNRKRIHGSLGYLSPDRFEDQYYKMAS
ncbi:IS3 family transposase [Paenibacillus sp. N3.4]|nr:IS3 family transposase [Paenibacillus sp. N3.4]